MLADFLFMIECERNAWYLSYLSNYLETLSNLDYSSQSKELSPSDWNTQGSEIPSTVTSLPFRLQFGCLDTLVGAIYKV